MLNQVHKLMQGMQNITNNIAHDLRTPLTRLRGCLEVIHNETSEGIKEALTETDNLLSTFNAMLRINKVESGAHKGHFTCIAIDNLLQDVLEFYELLSEDNEISITFDKKSILILMLTGTCFFRFLPIFFIMPSNIHTIREQLPFVQSNLK